MIGCLFYYRTSSSTATMILLFIIRENGFLRFKAQVFITTEKVLVSVLNLVGERNVKSTDLQTYTKK